MTMTPATRARTVTPIGSTRYHHAVPVPSSLNRLIELLVPPRPKVFVVTGSAQAPMIASAPTMATTPPAMAGPDVLPCCRTAPGYAGAGGPHCWPCWPVPHCWAGPGPHCWACPPPAVCSVLPAPWPGSDDAQIGFERGADGGGDGGANVAGGVRGEPGSLACTAAPQRPQNLAPAGRPALHCRHCGIGLSFMIEVAADSTGGGPGLTSCPGPRPHRYHSEKVSRWSATSSVRMRSTSLCRSSAR